MIKWLIFLFPIAVIISLVEVAYHEVRRIDEVVKHDRRQQKAEGNRREDEMKGGNSYE